MSAFLEQLLVGAAVVVAVLVALRALLPFAARVALARALHGRVPDRVVIWIAGREGCDACGGRSPPLSRR